MTTEEVLIKQRKIFSQIIEKDIPLKRAVRDTMAMQATRIFVEGKNSQGSLIGHGAYNDNKPLYVNPNTSPGKKFKPAGKPFEFGKTKSGKTKTVRAETRVIRRRISNVGFGRAIKGKSQVEQLQTRWFPSYKDYRQTIGRRIDRVDLFLSGDLKSDFSNSPGKKSNQVKERPMNVHEYVSGFSRNINALKAEGMEDKYNDKIFSLSKEEKENFFSVAHKEFQLIIANA